MNNEFTSTKSQTDWQRLDAMSDEDIDFSDCPEITPKMFAEVVRRGICIITLSLGDIIGSVGRGG